MTSQGALTLISMPSTLPPLAWGPRLWHATCSQAPGLHPRSSTLAPGLQRSDYIKHWPLPCLEACPLYLMILCFCCISSSLKADRAT